MCGVLQSVSTITKSDVTHKYISQNHDYKQLHILESEKHGLKNMVSNCDIKENFSLFIAEILRNLKIVVRQEQ